VRDLQNHLLSHTEPVRFKYTYLPRGAAIGFAMSLINIEGEKRSETLWCSFLTVRVNVDEALRSLTMGIIQSDRKKKSTKMSVGHRQ
jgi:hypothetical protein